jgi:two-component system sensor histidine kinase KdpD
MTRLESGILKINKEWFEIGDLIGQTLKTLKLPLSEHRVKNAPSSRPFYVQGDFQLLQHALSNILFNAAAYSPRGTEIGIHTEFHLGFVVIKVRDEGPGIPEELRSQIFEKFFRVPGTPTGGTGLGLAIAQSLVNAHGGRIEAGTAPGGGAEMGIWLPLPEAPPEIQEATG